MPDVEKMVGDYSPLGNGNVSSFIWRGVSVTVKDRQTHEDKLILNNVTGTVRAGELMAIMGPSYVFLFSPLICLLDADFPQWFWQINTTQCSRQPCTYKRRSHSIRDLPECPFSGRPDDAQDQLLRRARRYSGRLVDCQGNLDSCCSPVVAQGSFCQRPHISCRDASHCVWTYRSERYPGRDTYKKGYLGWPETSCQCCCSNDHRSQDPVPR